MHVNSRVQKHRDALRLAGLRPLQIWVPDIRHPGFSYECLQQCTLVQLDHPPFDKLYCERSSF